MNRELAVFATLSLQEFFHGNDLNAILKLFGLEIKKVCEIFVPGRFMLL